MYIACIKAGYYVLISADDDTGELGSEVLAEVRRTYKPAPKNSRARFWTDAYILKWRSTGVEERFRTLAELNEFYGPINYPGYNSILKERSNANNSNRRRHVSASNSHRAHRG